MIGATPAETRRLLEDLVDANLLGQHARGRYHFHDLVRQYAIGRLVAYYLAFGHAAEQVADPGRTSDPVRRSSSGLPDLGTPAQVKSVIDAEHGTIAAVIELAAGRGLHDEVAELAGVFGPRTSRVSPSRRAVPPRRRCTAASVWP